MFASLTDNYQSVEITARSKLIDSLFSACEESEISVTDTTSGYVTFTGSEGVTNPDEAFTGIVLPTDQSFTITVIRHSINFLYITCAMR